MFPIICTWKVSRSVWILWVTVYTDIGRHELQLRVSRNIAFMEINQPIIDWRRPVIVLLFAGTLTHFDRNPYSRRGHSSKRFCHALVLPGHVIYTAYLDYSGHRTCSNSPRITLQRGVHHYASETLYFSRAARQPKDRPYRLPRLLLPSILRILGLIVLSGLENKI